MTINLAKHPWPRRGSPAVKLTCPVCKDTFHRAPSDLKNRKPGWVPCCSHSCAAKRRQNRVKP